MTTLKKVSKLYFRSYKLRVKKNTYKKAKYTYYRGFMSYDNILKKNIRKITGEDLIYFQEYLKNRYTNDTAARVYYILINIFEFAKNNKVIRSNIARELKTLKLNRFPADINIFSDEEFYKMLLRIKDFQKRVFLELLFNTGLRNAEARALTWDCIDFDNKLIKINKSIYCQKYGTYELTTPKTRSSWRTIMVDKNTIKLLKLLKSKNTKGNFVFNNNGLPHTVNYCKIDMREACKKARLKHISTHELRHSHATNMLMKDIQIAFVSRRLGHINTKITEALYIHLIPNADKFIIKEIENRKKKLGDE